jgi:hypothetical protein
MVLDNVAPIAGTLLVLVSYGFAFWVVYYLVKMAVKSGVREGIVLADTDLKRVVRQGVADALAEHEARDRSKAAVAAQEFPAQ